MILLLKRRKNQTYGWALCSIYFRIWSEEDKNKDCAIYPIGGFKEFDKKTIRKLLEDLGLNNLTPILATYSSGEVTEQFIVKNFEQIRSLDIKYLHRNWDAWLPRAMYILHCTSTNTHTKFLSKSMDADNKTMVHIVFNLIRSQTKIRKRKFWSRMNKNKPLCYSVQLGVRL